MNRDANDLTELMLRADQICAVLERISTEMPRSAARDELKLKIGQSRNGISRLQSKFDADELRIANKLVQAELRLLVLNLIWAVFYARQHIDRRTYKLLVMIEFAFTGLLTGEGNIV